jgi:hypothetical protein
VDPSKIGGREKTRNLRQMHLDRMKGHLSVLLPGRDLPLGQALVAVQALLDKATAAGTAVVVKLDVRSRGDKNQYHTEYLQEVVSSPA